MRHSSTSRHLLRTSTAAVVAACLLTSCGGDDSRRLGSGDAADVLTAISVAQELAAAEAEAEAERAAAEAEEEVGATFGTYAEPEERTWDTDVTGWWDAWTITVDAVRATSDDMFSAVVLTLQVSNDSDQVRGIYHGDFSLELDGAVAETGFAQPPQVAARGTTSYELDFTLRGPFELERARLVFGHPSDNQAVLPLGGGEVDAFEPLELDVSGDLTTSTLDVEPAGPAHVAPSFAIGERGRYVVRIPLSLAYTGTATGGTAVMPTQFVLEAPDGTSSVGEPLIPGDIVAEVLFPGGAPQRFAIAFRTGEPQPGTYRVTLTDTDGTTATATFDVPATR